MTEPTRRNHGTAGHFIGARDCCFHLHTSVGQYRVSTIGCYHPGRRSDTPETVGPGRLYETMVFPIGEDGQPTSWFEVDFDAYDTEKEAENGHERMVRKYAKDESHGRS